jgi:5-methylcytosine-specific restriction endonuclease McrA
MAKKKKFRKNFGFLNNIYTTCEQCGGKFLVPDNMVRKYCSAKCRKDSQPHKDHIEEIFRRDNYTCVYCGKSSIEDGVKLAVDHVYPISKGGEADLFNLVTSCSHCNSEKNDKILPEDVILKLWGRNEKLNTGLADAKYNKLKEYFLSNLDLRMLRKR